MQLARLAPAGPPTNGNRRWTIAASALLHAAFFALLLAMTARRAPPEPAGAPSYDLVFDNGSAGQPGAPQQALPPAQPADVPTPDDAPPGAPAPPPTSAPAPDG
ncbi:MAG TPA: hypothetical protein VE650_21340, partial [Acetobacteraceae bacterium]|nr:hypothetical protein [Acetobacteraceae bacterium]